MARLRRQKTLAGFVVAAYSGMMTMARAEPLGNTLQLLMRLLDTGEAANRGEGR